MNALSLFDGMSGLQIALNRIGLKPSKYYAAEIDKYAIKVTQANYPNTIQLGSVTEWRDWDIDWSTIDIVTGGFPCQAWSMAGKQLGDKDERGMLFWTMLDIMKRVKFANPKVKFLIENVKMKKEFEEYITYHTEQALGEVNKVLINSALVSAQNRNRYYWTNWHVEQPEDKGIVLADIVESEASEHILSERMIKGFRNSKSVFRDRFKPHDLDTKKAYCLTARYYKQGKTDPYLVCDTAGNPIRHDTPQRVATATDIKGHDYNKRIYSVNGKYPTLASASGGNLEPKILCGSITGRKINPISGKRDDYNQDLKTEQRLEVRSDEKTGTLTTVQKDNVVVERDKQYRKLTPLECERLQTVPDGYSDHVSNSQRYKMLGNGWTIDVITHILSQMELPVKVVARQLNLFE